MESNVQVRQRVLAFCVDFFKIELSIVYISQSVKRVWNLLYPLTFLFFMIPDHFIREYQELYMNHFNISLTSEQAITNINDGLKLIELISFPYDKQKGK